MSIDVLRATEQDRDRWRRCVESSPQATPFHRLDALSTLDDHVDADLHLLLGLNGAEPVGALPVFVSRSGVSTAVRSPPRLLKSLPLGPALANLGKVKPRKAERYRAEFVEGALELIDDLFDPDAVHLRTDTRFDDVRPFRWNGLDAAPYYTYEVDLRPGADTVIEGFSGDARSNVRNTDPDRYEIRTGDAGDAAFVIDQVRRRHDEQDAEYRLFPSFVTDLYERLPDDWMRVYVCEVDGERATGMVTLEHGDRTYRWQGGVRTDVDVPTSDLLDWHIMQSAMDRDVEYYDLVGANLRRLSQYKSKFGPELRTYYNVRRREGLGAAVGDLRSAFRGFRDGMPFDVGASPAASKDGR